MVAAVRRALAAVRAAGLRGVGLALLTFAPPLVVALSPLAPLTVVGLILRATVLLALIRFLGAHRPGGLPPLPLVDPETGLRVGRPRLAIEPAAAPDRRARTALRAGVRLIRPAMRLTALQLLVLLAAPLLLVVSTGNKVSAFDETAQVLLALPLVALGAAFFGVVPQRIALEGDPRVLVAAAHSLRVARTAYGPLLLLSALQPAVAAAALLVVDPKDPTTGMVAAGGGLFALSVGFQLLTAATATEIYLAGPRLDVPGGFGAPDGTGVTDR